MTDPNSTNELSEAIETLIREYVADARAAAVAAIERGCDGSANLHSRRKPARECKTAVEPSPKRRHHAPKRSSTEIAALADRLYEVIVASPGESMVKFADEIGLTTRDLQLPIAKLKQAKRVRTTGARQFTRYFPVP